MPRTEQETEELAVRLNNRTRAAAIVAIITQRRVTADDKETIRCLAKNIVDSKER